MINFPIFEQSDVSDFGLFPGMVKDPRGLSIKFQPGLTLILGANGLGKTTLITILYRLLTGPFDIPALSERNDLGNANLQARALIPSSIEGDSFRGFPNGKKSESMRRTDTEVRHGQSGCVTGRF